MRKSIFARLMITYFILTLLITTSLALLLSYGFNQYIFTEKNRVLASAALKVEELVNSYYQEKLQHQELQLALDNLGFITDSTIYAVKLNKTALYNPQNQQLQEELAEDYLMEDLLKILNGESIYRRKQFSRALDTDVVFMGTPLRVDQEIIGAVLIFSPLNEINKYLARINTVIGVTALAALIISSLFIYITATRISRPIREMEWTASKIAAGEETQDLVIHTGDEVEGLANSFNHMKRQLAATERMRREFIANVSHDLRTPLTSINGFIQGMLDGVIPPAQYPKYLSLVQEETRRLMRLTGDILEMAKIQSGHVKLNIKEIHLQDIVKKVTESFDMSRDKKEISVTIDRADKLLVWADPDRLLQILHNLLGNALRYTGDGGTVSIEVREQEEWVVFSIKDTGVGIRQEDLPYIFDRFYRDDRFHQGYKGAGLGLSIVKHLVELHGGSIRAESRVGQGTTIVFLLPRR